jgi:hypothetical protein
MPFWFKLPRPVRFEEIAKLGDRGLTWDRLAAETDPHCRRVVQRFLHGRVGEIEAVLEEVHPHHALQPDGRPAVLGLRVHGLDAGAQPAPRHHPIYLGEKWARRVTFVYFSNPLPASVNCE